jgi:hypothetical protein
MSTYQTRAAFGPFHRLLAPKVQDTKTALKQLMSGEVWGGPTRWGNEVAKLQVAFVRITQDLLP